MPEDVFIDGVLITINMHLNPISCVGGQLYTEPYGRDFVVGYGGREGPSHCSPSQEWVTSKDF